MREAGIMYHGEQFNAWTHLVGALCLLVQALWEGKTLKFGSVAIYGGSLVVLYVISLVYHSVRCPEKGVLRKLDYNSICLLIAGIYSDPVWRPCCS